MKGEGKERRRIKLRKGRGCRDKTGDNLAIQIMFQTNKM
jgi:hypothetical protein